jgi:superfamily II DNA or RNA helicase
VHSSEYHPGFKDFLKSLPNRRWDPNTKTWIVPNTLVSLVADFCASANFAYELPKKHKEPFNADSLYDFQQEGLQRVLTEKRQILSYSTGLGKQQPVDEPVLTPSGFVPIGSIRIGDEVIGSDGKPTTVLGVFPQISKKVYRVEFSDGSWTRVGPEHLWSAATKYDYHRKHKYEVVNTEHIREHLDKEWRIPMIAQTDMLSVDKQLPVDPYTLGVILGDGCLRNNRCVITTQDDIVSFLTPKPNKIIPSGSPGVNDAFYLKSSDTWKHLHSLGLIDKLSWEKFVPDCYKYGTPATRLAILQGLLDTDGESISGTDRRPLSSLNFCTTSLQLANDVAFIAESLGGTARRTTRNAPRYTHRGEKKIGRKAYRVNVKLPSPLCPVRAAFRRAKWAPVDKYPPIRVIRDIQIEPDCACVCIQVDAVDNLYATRHCILTHNTVVTARALQAYGRLPFLIVCPEAARLNWIDELDRWYPDHPHVARIQYGRDRKLSKPKTIQRDAAYSAPGQVVGYSLLHEVAVKPWSVLVFDEAHVLSHPTSRQYKAALALAESNPHAMIIMLSATLVPTEVKSLYGPLSIIQPHCWGELIKSGAYSFDYLYRYSNGDKKVIPNFGSVWEFEGINEEHFSELQRRLNAVVHRCVSSDPTIAAKLPRIRTTVTRLGGNGSLEDEQSALEAKQARSQLHLAGLQKIAPVCERLGTLGDEPKFKLVFTWFRDTAKKIAENVGATCITGEMSEDQRRAAIKSVQDAGSGTIVATMGSCGIAINLGFCEYVLFAELCSSMMAMVQAMGRVMGFRSQNGALVEIMSLEDSLDEKVGFKLKQRLDAIGHLFKHGEGEEALLALGRSEQTLLDELDQILLTEDFSGALE